MTTLHNHVSVLAWGLGGQLNWQNAATREFSRSLYETLRQQDARPCYVETSQPADAEGHRGFRADHAARRRRQRRGGTGAEQPLAGYRFAGGQPGRAQ